MLVQVVTISLPLLLWSCQVSVMRRHEKKPRLDASVEKYDERKRRRIREGSDGGCLEEDVEADLVFGEILTEEQ